MRSAGLHEVQLVRSVVPMVMDGVVPADVLEQDDGEGGVHLVPSCVMSPAPVIGGHQSVMK